MAASREEVFERVKEVLTEQLGIEEADITEEASFQEDLDADSLDLVELIMELEDQFEILIPNWSSSSMISSTRSSESASRSSWNDASSVMSASSIPSCSVSTSLTRSKTSSRDAAMSPHSCRVQENRADHTTSVCRGRRAARRPTTSWSTPRAAR